MTHMKWFDNNYIWLKTWIDKAMPYGDTYLGTKPMQIIKTICRSRLRFTGNPDKRIVDASYFLPDILAFTREAHIRSILQSAVFGTTSISPREGTGIDFRMVSSYLEQKLRLPTRQSFAQILYLEGNGVCRWMQEYYFPYRGRDSECIPYYMILSEYMLITSKRDLPRRELK